MQGKHVELSRVLGYTAKQTEDKQPLSVIKSECVHTAEATT